MHTTSLWYRKLEPTGNWDYDHSSRAESVTVGFCDWNDRLDHEGELVWIQSNLIQNCGRKYSSWPWYRNLGPRLRQRSMANISETDLSQKKLPAGLIDSIGDGWVYEFDKLICKTKGDRWGSRPWYPRLRPETETHETTQSGQTCPTEAPMWD